MSFYIAPAERAQIAEAARRAAINIENDTLDELNLHFSCVELAGRLSDVGLGYAKERVKRAYTELFAPKGTKSADDSWLDEAVPLKKQNAWRATALNLFAEMVESGSV